MNILGIDPGLERIGVSIVEKVNQQYVLKYNRLIKTSSKDPFIKRLNAAYTELFDIIKNNRIDGASIEKLFFTKNVKTAMDVSEVRGVLQLALYQNSIPIYEYTPLQVKQGLVGYGRATKQQIQQVLKMMLKLDEVPKSDDVADSMALAIVHINTYQTLSKIKC